MVIEAIEKSQKGQGLYRCTLRVDPPALGARLPFPLMQNFFKIFQKKSSRQGKNKTRQISIGSERSVENF